MSEANLNLTVASRSHDDRDWVHVIVVTLGKKEIHRDGIYLDNADDRRRFIDDLVKKLPAITDGAEVSSDDIDTQLIALASKSSSRNKGQSLPKFKSVKSGTKVHADDRDNIGEVLTDHGDSCSVRFVSPEGDTAVKSMPKSILRTMDGKPLQSSVNDAKPEPFPLDVLPSVVRQYVIEGAEARAADPSIVALPAYITLGACIGLTRRIAPKKDWTAPAILWGAVVARSGSVKSVGYDLAHELLKAAEDENHRDHLAAKEMFRLTEMEHQKAINQWKRTKDVGEPPETPEPPIAKRLVVDDQTVESLAPLLEENPRGLFMLTDELRGWFAGMGAYSASGSGGRDEARWLALFEGRAFNVDRKTNRERTYIPEAGVSVSGTIQPGTLARVVCDGQVESGLLARILLVMPEPRAKKWTDTEMSETTRLAMQRVVDKLKTLDFEVVDGFSKAIVLSLTDEAKQRFIRFVNSHGVETITHGDALAAVWSKLEGYALRFALVDHLIRWASGDPNCDPDGPVGIKSIEAGIELSRWFAGEAERVYGLIGITSETGDDAKDFHVDRLAEWLESRSGSATEREIGRGPQRYRGKDNEHIEADCTALIDAGRARWDVSRKTRRMVLIGPGDSGDSDTSAVKTGKSAHVSPSDDASTTDDPATVAKENGDTCVERTGNPEQVSPSPGSPPPTSAERVKVTL